MAILPLQKRVKPRKKIYDLIIVITSLILNLFQKISPIRQVSELIKTFFNSALDNIPVSTFEWSLQGGQLLFTNLYISNNKLFSYVFVVVENSNVKVFAVHAALTIDRWLRSHLEDGVQANQRPSFPWSSQENTHWKSTCIWDRQAPQAYSCHGRSETISNRCQEHSPPK